MLGDIVKVTPTSKAVGDLALFMVANDLSAADVVNGTRELAYPASVIDLVGGMMGQPPGGFPEAVEKSILKDKPAMKGRPVSRFRRWIWRRWRGRSKRRSVGSLRSKRL